MINVQAKFSGIQALEMVMLRDLSPDKQSRILNEALLKAAKIVEQKMITLAPKRTGALRAAIGIVPHKLKPGRVRVSIGVGDGWFAGDEYYAGFQEWGWHLGRRTSRGKGSKAKDKRPFFTPPHAGYAEKALAQTADVLTQVAEDIIVQRVQEAFND